MQDSQHFVRKSAADALWPAVLAIARTLRKDGDLPGCSRQGFAFRNEVQES